VTGQRERNCLDRKKQKSSPDPWKDRAFLASTKRSALRRAASGIVVFGLDPRKRHISRIPLPIARGIFEE
jgi:hypothetical protein